MISKIVIIILSAALGYFVSDLVYTKYQNSKELNRISTCFKNVDVRMSSEIMELNEFVQLHKSGEACYFKLLTLSPSEKVTRLKVRYYSLLSSEKAYIKTHYKGGLNHDLQQL